MPATTALDRYIAPVTTTRFTVPYRVTHELPEHLRSWVLPPEWQWGAEGVAGEYRHYQEVIDALGRSLSLVTVPDPVYGPWLAAEARHLAHRNHPSVPTTYHYWAPHSDAPRGPGYLRRWITGETVGASLRRSGSEDIPHVLHILRAVGSTVAYLHDLGTAHGALSPETVWVGPTGRVWMLGWQWSLPVESVPEGLVPNGASAPPPEWADGVWRPSAASDQWQLGAVCFAALSGEAPPTYDVPPIQLVRPECPQGLAAVIDRALHADPAQRHRSVSAMLRALDRVVIGRPTFLIGEWSEATATKASEEARLRWATADDYEVLAALGSGSFGSVWQVRDLALEREVALKMLHPHVATDEKVLSRFRREARLAARLAHPGIVPIYDWDRRGDVSWYTMELAEGGSVADLIARSGSRPLAEVAPQVELVLDALASAHSIGIVHRDLKPENLLIDRYRRWRITDFGIAHIPGEDVSGPTGTPAFAPPEQLLGEPQGPPADYFAVAAIVAYVLSGRPPFGDVESKQILARQLSGQIDLSEFPGPIAAWLRRGLAIDPDARFGDAMEMQRVWHEAVRQTLGEQRRSSSSSWWRRWLVAGDTEEEPDEIIGRLGEDTDRAAGV